MADKPELSSTAKEMLYQFKLSIYQVRVGFLLAASIALLFLGWGGTISIIIAAGTLDPVNPPANAWPTMAAVSGYLLVAGIMGIVLMIAAGIYFLVVGGKLKKEAESFK